MANIKIDKNIFFELLNSHSTLSEIEMKINKEFSKDHFAMKAEKKVLDVLYDLGIEQEYFDYSESNILCRFPK